MKILRFIWRPQVGASLSLQDSLASRRAARRSSLARTAGALYRRSMDRYSTSTAPARRWFAHLAIPGGPHGAQASCHLPAAVRWTTVGKSGMRPGNGNRRKSCCNNAVSFARIHGPVGSRRLSSPSAPRNRRRTAPPSVRASARPASPYARRSQPASCASSFTGFEFAEPEWQRPRGDGDGNRPNHFVAMFQAESPHPVDRAGSSGRKTAAQDFSSSRKSAYDGGAVAPAAWQNLRSWPSPDPKQFKSPIGYGRFRATGRERSSPIRRIGKKVVEGVGQAPRPDRPSQAERVAPGVGRADSLASNGLAATIRPTVTSVVSRRAEHRLQDEQPARRETEPMATGQSQLARLRPPAVLGRQRKRRLEPRGRLLWVWTIRLEPDWAATSRGPVARRQASWRRRVAFSTSTNPRRTILRPGPRTSRGAIRRNAAANLPPTKRGAGRPSAADARWSGSRARSRKTDRQPGGADARLFNLLLDRFGGRERSAGAAAGQFRGVRLCCRTRPIGGRSAVPSRTKGGSSAAFSSFAAHPARAPQKFGLVPQRVHTVGQNGGGFVFAAASSSHATRACGWLSQTPARPVAGAAARHVGANPLGQRQPSAHGQPAPQGKQPASVRRRCASAIGGARAAIKRRVFRGLEHAATGRKAQC